MINLDLAIKYLTVGKGLSWDLFPDDTFTKEELLELSAKDFRVLFNAPLSKVLTNAKAMLLSKNGSKIVTQR